MHFCPWITLHSRGRPLRLGLNSYAKPLKVVLVLSAIILGMSTSTLDGLGNLLFGRTRGAILALLYGRADQSFYTRQIAREVDASVGAVQRELEDLSKVGLIIRSSVGSQVFYQANRHAPIFREMQALVKQDNWHLQRLAISIASFSEASHCGICVRIRRARGRNGTE
jgi:hypothetical protein